jgi:hypothetical protein
MKPKSITDTPLVSDLSLIVTNTLATERLAGSIKACDDGVASPVELAFACACFPCGNGIRIPRTSAPSVRLILRLWSIHARKLSRRFSDALKSLPSRIEKSRRNELSQEKRGLRGSIRYAGKCGRSQGAGAPDRVSGKRLGDKLGEQRASQTGCQPTARITRTNRPQHPKVKQRTKEKT